METRNATKTRHTLKTRYRRKTRNTLKATSTLKNGRKMKTMYKVQTENQKNISNKWQTENQKQPEIRYPWKTRKNEDPRQDENWSALCIMHSSRSPLAATSHRHRKWVIWAIRDAPSQLKWDKKENSLGRTDYQLALMVTKSAGEILSITATPWYYNSTQLWRFFVSRSSFRSSHRHRKWAIWAIRDAPSQLRRLEKAEFARENGLSACA